MYNTGIKTNNEKGERNMYCRICQNVKQNKDLQLYCKLTEELTCLNSCNCKDFVLDKRIIQDMQEITDKYIDNRK